MKNAGFSIIELVFVIAIVGLLVFAGVTKMDFTTGNLDAAARGIRSNIQFAQDLAMTHGSAYGFRSINQTSYEIFDGAPGTPAKSPLTNSNLTVDISPVQFSGTVSAISFDSGGKPNISVDTNILLTGDGGTRTITVENNTGFVRIEP